MANVSFTKEEVKKMIGGFKGDFKAFQQYLESPNVCFEFHIERIHWLTLLLQFGSHSNVHEIVGG